MNFIKYIVLGFLILLSDTQKAGAQDAKTDLKKIGDAYKNVKLLSIGIQYAMYADHSTKVATEEKTGYAVVSKDLYYNSFADIEILRSKSVGVVADHAKKLLVLKSVKINKKEKVFPVDIDSELKSYKSVSYSKINDKVSQYTLELKKGKISKVVFQYNNSTYFIEKMAIYYKDPQAASGQTKTPPRVEIAYTNHILSSKNEAGVSVEKYFSIVKGKYVPKGPFSKYHFINQLN